MRLKISKTETTARWEWGDLIRGEFGLPISIIILVLCDTNYWLTRSSYSIGKEVFSQRNIGAFSILEKMFNYIQLS